MRTNKKRTILVVEDDSAQAGLLMTIIEKQGYKARHAFGAAEAFEEIEKRIPDLIFLDINLPLVNGFEICDQLKNKSDTKEIPVVFISGQGDSHFISNAYKSGGVDYISKPFKIEKIQGLIRTHLEVVDTKNKLQLQVEDVEIQKKLSDRKLGSIIEAFNGYIYASDQKYNLTYVNPAFKRKFGDIQKNHKCYQLIYELSSPCSWCPESKEFARENLIQKEIQNLSKGTWYHAMMSFSQNQQSTERQVTLLDITERKNELIALKEREDFLSRENTILRHSLSERFRFGELIGKSLAMQEVYELITNAANSDANIIIYGESGTGKELVAKEIHKNSERKNQPMVYVNCGAIPENLIESEFFGYKKGAFTGAESDKKGYLSKADKGILFLDEVGEIPINMQVKLLRAIEGGGFTPVGSNEHIQPDIRIIAATNRDLKEEVKKGIIRSDFFYRIHIIPVEIPPLRNRKEDIGLLIDHFWGKYGQQNSNVLTGRIKDALIKYHWPGNVRELENTLRRLATVKKLDFLDVSLNDEELCSSDIDFEDPELSLAKVVSELEKKVITKALEKCRWKKVETAALLKIDRKTLTKKMDLYEIRL